MVQAVLILITWPRCDRRYTIYRSEDILGVLTQ